ncbi:MAG: arylsulfotransferase (ASST) [Candidatus Omnitrophota bacterium]|jgi:hypothetical protein|nr:MAG: arylsulfotransferase (ASST) [Candidatus Omnitrophota bacterium]
MKCLLASKRKKYFMALLIVVGCSIGLVSTDAIDMDSPSVQVFDHSERNSPTSVQLERMQPHPVGLIQHDPRSFNGYTLITRVNSTSTYLIDNEGRIVNEWKSDQQGFSAYLLPNGRLLRTIISDTEVNHTFLAGGITGRVQELAWDGTVVWDFTYLGDNHALHHGMEPLPNGNILMIAWERKTAREAMEAGRSLMIQGNNDLWSDHIIEVKPTGKSSGEIVWEWHVWDHLIQNNDSTLPNFGIITEHPEQININPIGWEEHLLPDDLERLQSIGYVGGDSDSQPDKTNADWTHMNAVSYHPEFDQIAISVPGFHEIWIIDHRTTSAEAAGHHGGKRGKGGDLLYRWGNPLAYAAGSENDQQLFAQHDVQWISQGRKGAGNLLLFNNGRGRWDGEYSSVIEITLPIDQNGNYKTEKGRPFVPVRTIWNYSAPQKTDFYASFLSGAQRLPNGNTLICNGMTGAIFEITENGEIVWHYFLPNDDVDSIAYSLAGYRTGLFTVRRYAPEFSGLVDQNLTPGDTIEAVLKNPT